MAVNFFFFSVVATFIPSILWDIKIVGISGKIILLKVLLFLRGLGAATATASSPRGLGRTFPLIILLSRLRNQSCVDWIRGPS